MLVYDITAQANYIKVYYIYESIKYVGNGRLISILNFRIFCFQTKIVNYQQYSDRHSNLEYIIAIKIRCLSYQGNNHCFMSFGIQRSQHSDKSLKKLQLLQAEHRNVSLTCSFILLSYHHMVKQSRFSNGWQVINRLFGWTLVLLLVSSAMSQTCGNGVYQTPSEECDDANLINGDGCSSLCKVQKNYRCAGAVGTQSVCKIDTIVNLTFIGVQRDTRYNEATLYFLLEPYFPAYVNVNFDSLLVSQIPHTNMQIFYSTKEHMLKVTVQYTEDIQNTYHHFMVLLNQTNYFWNPSDDSKILLNGVNCELTYDQNLWMHNVMLFFILIMVGVSFGVFVASIFFEKWIGLQLMQTYQAVYFIFAMMDEYPFQFSAIYEYIRYSNGYDDIMSSDYYRTYTLSKHLNALSMQKEFISNYNILFLVVLVCIVIMIILGMLKRRYRLMLQEQISREVTKKLKKVDKVYSFVFGRVFIMLTFLSMFKIIFSFNIQMSNQYSIVEVFIDEFNITVGLLAFIIVFGMISFVLFWYLLLPANFTEEQQFMSLKFQNMNFYYPAMYLGYQTLFILLLSIYFSMNSDKYIVLSVQILYLILLIATRPYNTIRKINKTIHNITIIFNQVVVIITTSIVIRWDSILGTPYQVLSNYELTVYFFLLLILLAICTGLAIARLAMFNKQITCRCCKKQNQNEIQEISYDNMKKQLNDDKTKLLHPNYNDEKVSMSKNQEKQTIQPKRKETIRYNNDQDEFVPNDDSINRFLNDKYVVWNKGNQNNAENRKIMRNIKKSTAKKTATYIKSPLQEYIQMQMLQKLQKEENQIRPIS